MDTGVLLLHGLFEHKGRHQINADWFKNLNISPYLIDLPGHGENSTTKGHIDSWEENNEALKKGFENLENYSKKIIFGHSYGALIATYGVINKIVEPDFLILSAPSFKDNYPKFMRSLSKPLGNLAPKLRTISPVTKKNLSTDKDVVQSYFNDPLVFRTFTFKLGSEIVNVQDYVQTNINNLSIPTIVLHGDNDKICPINGNEKIANLQNVNFVTVKNSMHEILNQDTRMFVLSEIHKWMKENNIS